MKINNERYTELDNATFENFVLQGNGTVAVVVFTANRFGSAQILDRFVDSLSNDYPNFNFFRMNIEESGKYGTELGVRKIPTLLFFKNGEIIDYIEEMLPFSMLKQKLDDLEELSK